MNNNRIFGAGTGYPGFLLLAVVLLLAELARSAFLLSFLPAYAEKMGLSVAAAGLAVSAHYIADTLVKLVAGYVLDRFPARLLMHGFWAAGAAGLAVAYTADEPWALVSGAVLVGAGASPIWLVILSRVREGKRGSQMGSIYTVWLAALGLGPVAMNFALDGGNALPIWLMGGFWGASWLLAALAMNGDRTLTAAHSDRSLPRRNRLRPVGLKDKLGPMKPLLPGMMLQTSAAGLLVPVLPVFAAGTLKLSYSSYSLLLITGGLTAALFLIPMGRLSDRWGYRRFLAGGFAGLAAALFLLPYSRETAGTFLLAAFLGLACSAVLPAWNAYMSRFVPQDQRATGWGVLSGVEGVGIMLGPAAGGWIAGRYGDTAALAVSAFLLLLLAAYYGLTPLDGGSARRETNRVRQFERR